MTILCLNVAISPACTWIKSEDITHGQQVRPRIGQRLEDLVETRHGDRCVEQLLIQSSHDMLAASGIRELVGDGDG